MLEIIEVLLSILQPFFTLDPSYTITAVPFVALWPDFSDSCVKCRREIEGTSFFSFSGSGKKYCNECRSHLSEKELAEEAASVQDFTKLLREVEQALGYDCRGLTDEEVREQASSVFLCAVMNRKRQQDEERQTAGRSASSGA